MDPSFTLVHKFQRRLKPCWEKHSRESSRPLLPRSNNYGSLTPAPSRYQSINPPPSFPTANPTRAPKMTIPATEVSRGLRLLQVSLAVLYCLLAAGVVFGYAAIKPIFVGEGVYREYCSADEIEEGVYVCYYQELRLNFMFTCAAVVTNVSALPVGSILDRYGPRITAMIGSVFFAIGCLLLAFAWNLKPFDAYILGYLFLALGGPFVFISSFQLCNTFPAHSGLILSMLTGAFDASSAVFLFYRLIYSATNGSFFPRKFFLAYLVVPAFILLAQIFIMPKESYKSVGELVKVAEEGERHESDEELTEAEREEIVQIRRESAVSEITELLGPKGEEEHIKHEEMKREACGVWGAMHGRTVRTQLRSLWWILITVFTLLQMTMINYRIATIRPHIEYLLDSFDKAREMNKFFDVALPLGGLVSVPFIGLLLDSTSTAFALSVLVGSTTLISFLGLLPFTWAAYLTIVIFVAYRPFYYTAVSDYFSKIFGFETFGTVYGTTIMISGLFNFSQSGLDALTHKIFNGDPRPADLLLMGLSFIVGVALVMFVAMQARGLKRRQLEEEAERAAEVRMPGVY